MSPPLRLKSARRPSRIVAGHVWAYRSEVVLPDGLRPGAVVALHDARGAWIGRGYANPHSEIAFRLLTRRNDEPIDAAFFQRAVHAAWQLRVAHGLANEPCRVVFSEGDGLPGFIVDRYPPVLVVAFGTAGAHALREPFLAALRDLFPDDAIVERSDTARLAHEGVAARVGVMHGAPVLPVPCRFDGIPVTVDPLHGQKTGAFLDAREMRRHLRAHAAGTRVLDCFAHVGLFARYALAGGATTVTCVETDAAAVARLRVDLPQAQVIAEDAFDVLRTLARERAQFDRVVLDPPPFAKDARSTDGALRGYKEINVRGFRLLAPGGLLYTSSCSYHVDRATFLQMLRAAAADAHGDYRVVALYTAAPDHPIRLGVPETDYFKGVIVERRS